MSMNEELGKSGIWDRAAKDIRIFGESIMETENTTNGEP